LAALYVRSTRARSARGNCLAVDSRQRRMAASSDNEKKRIAAGKHASFEATVRGRESIPPESGLAGLTAQAECRQGAGANCVLNVHRVATIPTQPFAW